MDMGLMEVVVFLVKILTAYIVMLIIKYVMNAYNNILLIWMDGVTTVRLTTVMNAQTEILKGIKMFAQIVRKGMALMSQ